MLRNRLSIFSLCGLLILSATGIFAGDESAFGARLKVVGSQHAAVRPYLLEPSTLQPLAPNTLRRATTLPPIRLGQASQSPPILISNSGDSVLAAIWNPSPYSLSPSTTVRIIDARTGKVLPPVHPAVPLFMSSLSTDGSEILGEHQSSGFTTDWYALSASTGQVVHDIKLDSISSNAPWVYDSVHRRLFVLNITYLGVQGSSPKPPVLVTYDAVTGHQIAHLTLNGVLAGSWTIAHDNRGDPVIADWQPGFALSPDGRQIAVVDGSSDTLSLIDAESLQLVRRASLSQPSSVVDRLASWLGFAPTPALAKQVQGVSLQMQFSPDGRRLYMMGYQSAPGANGTLIWQGLGIEVIDVHSGQIAGESLRKQPTLWLQPSPDGKSVYSLTWSGHGQSSVYPVILRRHDPATLKVMATHRFRRPVAGGAPQVYLVASG